MLEVALVQILVIVAMTQEGECKTQLGTGLCERGAEQENVLWAEVDRGF